MKKIFVMIAFITMIFISCKNVQKNINSVPKNENNSLVYETNQKETGYYPAIERYLVNELGKQYRQGEYCVPFQTVIDVDERNSEDILVWGDFWVFNYNLVGDTLETVSGGNHPGLMHIKQTDKGFEVTAFDAVEDGSNNIPSAKRIFGDKYEIFHAVNSDDKRREKHRAEVLANYVKKNNIVATKYKGYGWPEKQLPLE
jgi:hypothetical protein